MILKTIKAYVCLLTGMLFCINSALSQHTIAITPMPVSMKVEPGFFLLDSSLIVVGNENTINASAFFTGYLKKQYSIALNVISTSKKTGSLSKKELLLIPSFEQLNPSAYTLTVTDSNIVISGSSEGIFYGIQSLIQLLPVEPAIEKRSSLNIPCIIVRDEARFPYRGMHLDVSRHFFTVAEVKQYLDYLALHKINKFHWHLTDDQGWRIEIQKFPKLTATGSCRNQTLVGPFGSNRYDGKKYCHFYTRAEIRDIVQYAKERYIDIIPEIDIPGHSLAALAAYPYLGCTKGPYQTMETWGVAEESLCAGNDSTYAFIKSVFDEVMELFPYKMIHIGGDECVKTRWKQCKDCQAKIKVLQLKDEEALQAHFIKNIANYLHSKGKTAMGWDEILQDSLPKHAAIMSWRGESGGIRAAQSGHFVVMTPETPLYLNHAQSNHEDSITQGGYNPIEQVYAYNPLSTSLVDKASAFVLGAQGNMWSEYITNFKKLEYQLFPRLAALSEALWTPVEKKNWNEFENRLPSILHRYAFWKANYSQAFYEIQSKPGSFNGAVTWDLSSKNKDKPILIRNDSTGSKYFEYRYPLVINQSGLWEAVLANADQTPVGTWQKQFFSLHKGAGKNISLTDQPDKAYSFGGAFTLVDGVRNTMGMTKSVQFLGFWGRDLEARIDLGESISVDSVIVNIFEQPESWIYRPASVSLFESKDGIHYSLLQTLHSGTGTRQLQYKFSRSGSRIRYLSIKAENYGKIPDGKPGAGNNAWLFADEIEIK